MELFFFLGFPENFLTNSFRVFTEPSTRIFKAIPAVVSSETEELMYFRQLCSPHYLDFLKPVVLKIDMKSIPTELNYCRSFLEYTKNAATILWRIPEGIPLNNFLWYTYLEISRNSSRKFLKSEKISCSKIPLTILKLCLEEFRVKFLRE